MTEMLTITDAIQRVIKFCEDKQYRIKSDDPTAIGLGINKLSQGGLILSDKYEVVKNFNFQEIIIRQGSLVELLYDFHLMKNGEYLEDDRVELPNGDYMQRRAQIRQPWARN